MEETRYTFARRKQTLNRIEHLYDRAIAGKGPRRLVALAAGSLAAFLSVFLLNQSRGADLDFAGVVFWVLVGVAVSVVTYMAVVRFATTIPLTDRDEVLQLLISYDPLNEEAFGDLQRVVDGEGNIAQVDMAQWLLAERKALWAAGLFIKPPLNPLAHQLRNIDRA